jgi:diadenylate cyclase
VEEIVGAVERLSSMKIGALIAVEGEVGLDEYAQSGNRLQARVSREILGAIFTPNSPLHDGAVIISGDTIKAAGAILPLNRAPVPDRTLGTRHRAAIGLSEDTDAVVVVVSEETGRVSVASGGVLRKEVDGASLREAIAGAVPRPAENQGTERSAGRALARALRLP